MSLSLKPEPGLWGTGIKQEVLPLPNCLASDCACLPSHGYISGTQKPNSPLCLQGSWEMQLFTCPWTQAICSSLVCLLCTARSSCFMVKEGFWLEKGREGPDWKIPAQYHMRVGTSAPSWVLAEQLGPCHCSLQSIDTSCLIDRLLERQTQTSALQVETKQPWKPPVSKSRERASDLASV